MQFSTARALITCEIMRSEDAQFNNGNDLNSDLTISWRVIKTNQKILSSCN